MIIELLLVFGVIFFVLNISVVSILYFFNFIEYLSEKYSAKISFIAATLILSIFFTIVYTLVIKDIIIH
jgi:hypothetical protein